MDRMPASGGDVVPQRVFVRMRGYPGVSRGARREEHEHLVVAAGGVGGAHERVAAERHLAVVVEPALALSAYEYLYHAGVGLGGLFGVQMCLSVGRAYDGADAGGVEAVFKVVQHQLVRGGNGYSSDLVEREHAEPELIVALEHQHHPVAPLYSDRQEVVGRHVRVSRHVAECEGVVALVGPDPEHRAPVGRFRRDPVDYVEGEVESVLVFEGDAVHDALVVERKRYEVVGDRPLGDLLRRDGVLGIDGVLIERAVGLGGLEDYGVDLADPASHRTQGVRIGTVVVDGVALVQYLHPVVDPDLEFALYDDVDLLAVVLGEDGRLVLRFGRDADPEGFGRLVLERRRKVVVGESGVAGDGHPLAFSRHCIEFEIRARSFEYVAHLDPEGRRGLVYEREGKVLLALFQRTVFGERYFGAAGRLLLAHAGNFAKSPYTGGHFAYFFCHHYNDSPFFNSGRKAPIRLPRAVCRRHPTDHAT